MARTRSSLASYGLAESYVALPSASAPPVASELPSLGRQPKVALVNYPCRLRSDQVQAMKHLQSTLGVLPADLIRDFIDLGLRHVKEHGIAREEHTR